MRIPRIYHPEPLSTHETIMLSSGAANHIANVLRMRVNQQIILFDGSGIDFAGVITALAKKQVSVTLNQALPNQTESPLITHLGQAICRGDKMDWIIQKSVELGIKQITPLMTQHSQFKWPPQQKQKKWQHWHNIMINSCEQCGRSLLPTLDPITTLQNWLSQTHSGTCLILDPAADQSARLANDNQQITLLCGPESGFDQQEIDTAKQSGFCPTQIGPRILRAETAAVAMLACLQWQWGDFH